MVLAVSKPAPRERLQVRSSSPASVRTPQLSVVIVNYHQWANTAHLVRQLRLSRAMRENLGEVVIVDNHSPRHPLARRLRRCPGVALRRWGRNRGFARAVNEGCRLSQGEWILLLNPDMHLPVDFLDDVASLAKEMTATRPRAGIVGLGLQNEDGSPQSSAGFFPTLWSTLTRFALPRAQRKYHSPPVERRWVDWVTGCGMLLRRDCWHDVAGFDKDFFLYYEDVDICRRAWTGGWSVWYEPAIRATHFNPLHRRAVSPALRVVTRHSLLTYAVKHWPRWQFQTLTGIIRAEALWRSLRAPHSDHPRAHCMWRELHHLTVDMAQNRLRKASRRIHRLAAKTNFYGQ